MIALAILSCYYSYFVYLYSLALEEHQSCGGSTTNCLYLRINFNINIDCYSYTGNYYRALVEVVSHHELFLYALHCSLPPVV